MGWSLWGSEARVPFLGRDSSTAPPLASFAVALFRMKEFV